MDRAEHIARGHVIAHLGLDHHADTWIDCLALLLPPATQCHGRQPDGTCVDGLDIAAIRGCHSHMHRGSRQDRPILRNTGIATLRRDKRGKLGERRTAGDGSTHTPICFLPVMRRVGDQEHFRRHRFDQLLEVRGAFAAQRVDRFLHFQRIADGLAKRLLHLRDQCRGLASRQAANGNHEARESAGVFQGFHKGAVAALDVEHDGIGAGGQLLAHDAARNQRQARNCAGDVTQRIECLVRGGQIGRLRRDDEPDFRQLAAKLRF